MFAPAALRGTLAGLSRGEVAGRGSAQERTVFKSVGTALEDLAAAVLATQAGAAAARLQNGPHGARAPEPT